MIYAVLQAVLDMIYVVLQAVLDMIYVVLQAGWLIGWLVGWLVGCWYILDSVFQQHACKALMGINDRIGQER